MKKSLITTTLAISAIAFAFAEDGGVRPQMGKILAPKRDGGMMATTSRPGMPPHPMMTTGSSTVDLQVKALREEMEMKIKAIQDEYEAKIKAIAPDMRPMIVRPDGSTTTVPEARHEENSERQNMMQPNQGASAQQPRPFSGLGNFFRGLLGMKSEQ